VAPGDFTFFAAIVDGAVLSYQWRHEGVPLEDGERITGSDSLVVVILDVVPEDAGAYDCLITYELGCDVITDSATLTVLTNCPADFDDNGAVAPFDLAILLPHRPRPPSQLLGSVSIARES
jgi:hypothetical protein